MEFMGEWVDSHSRGVSERNATIIAGGRWSLQLRFWAAIIYEILDVLDKLTKATEFLELQAALSTESQEALGRLVRVRQDTGGAMRNFLQTTRNRAAYHYDHNAFKNALSRLYRRS